MDVARIDASLPPLEYSVPGSGTRQEPAENEAQVAEQPAETAEDPARGQNIDTEA